MYSNITKYFLRIEIKDEKNTNVFSNKILIIKKKKKTNLSHLKLRRSRFRE